MIWKQYFSFHPHLPRSSLIQSSPRHHLHACHRCLSCLTICLSPSAPSLPSCLWYITLQISVWHCHRKIQPKPQEAVPGASGQLPSEVKIYSRSPQRSLTMIPFNSLHKTSPDDNTFIVFSSLEGVISLNLAVESMWKTKWPTPYYWYKSTTIL